jgi:hypothetical protein
MAVLLRQLGHRGLHLVRVGNIGGQGHRLSTGGADLVGDAFRIVLRMGENTHRATLGRETNGGRLADTRSSAGNQRDFTCKAHLITSKTEGERVVAAGTAGQLARRR